MYSCACPVVYAVAVRSTNVSRKSETVRPCKADRLKSAVSARQGMQGMQGEGNLVAENVSRRDAFLKIAGATALVLSPAAPAFAAPAIGDAAPAFTLPSTSGKDISLSELTNKGTWTVLYFYNQDFTTGCSLEATRFQQALPDFKAAKAQVIGVSMDALEKHAEFCSKKGLTFPLLSDDTGTVSASYGADLKIPFLGKFSDRQTFLIDPSGVVRAHWLERDGSMADVKSPAHTQQILEQLKQLSA